MTGMSHHTQILLVEMGGVLTNLLPELASNHDEPNICLLIARIAGVRHSTRPWIVIFVILYILFP
jgi:hypothetical protein